MTCEIRVKYTKSLYTCSETIIGKIDTNDTNSFVIQVWCNVFEILIRSWRSMQANNCADIRARLKSILNSAKVMLDQLAYLYMRFNCNLLTAGEIKSNRLNPNHLFQFLHCRHCGCDSSVPNEFALNRHSCK